MVTEAQSREEFVDAVVVGAGFAGVYAIHKLQTLGLDVRAFEVGKDVGGTWYWNKYPGARCDVESMDYSYGFSDQIQQAWDWKHRFSFQPDIQRYIAHVADEFDLRGSINFETRVLSQRYDVDKQLWTVKTDKGETIECRYCIMATGNLTVPNFPDIPGLSDFEGELYHSARWPENDVDFSDKRVAVFGTGATGVQIIPEAAKTAKHVYVMQRTPNYSVPARNRELNSIEISEKREGYAEKRKQARDHLFGVAFIPEPTRPLMDLSEEESKSALEELWEVGGSINLQLAFNDIMKDERANKRVSDFVRSKIMETVDDPETARQLCPTDHPIGSKRICVDTGYYEAFNQANVELVNLRRTPVTRISEEAIHTDEAALEVDAIVFATGFDAITGALSDIDIIGRHKMSLAEEWKTGPSAFLGYTVHGFPNLFTITGPGSPSVKSNMVLSIEEHVDLIADTIQYLQDNNIGSIEVSRQAEDDWMDHVASVANQTLYVAADSWYTGGNIPGKARKFTVYVGGVDKFGHAIRTTVENDFQEFLKVPSSERHLV